VKGPAHVVVVGASAAGLATVEGLRRLGFDGRLTLIGEEMDAPYDRPPLSKQLLAGLWEPARLSLRTPEELVALDLEARLGARAVALDTVGRQVVLADRDRVGYDQVVVATGVRARRLPGVEACEGAHVLRTMGDALGLRAELGPGRRLIIVGGGFIGAEAAAVARQVGCEATLVTDISVPMGEALGIQVGGMLAEVHAAHGVRVETGALVETVLTRHGRATGVRLSGGRTLDADVVLVGIGARPNVEWLAGSGVPVGDGVECDATLYAGNGVWAAGDVASWLDEATGQRLRIEHRTNAGEQGLAVARNILAGREAATAFTTVPYVWSDQYDLKIQVHGRARGADEFLVVDGDLAQRRFTALYGNKGHVCAAVGVNMIRELRRLRPLVATHTPWSELPGAIPTL
jgi:3-phenylpropionate/trans-cinnamate dioxygenase ferredoxin reductase subunit